jgi:hypothetical protein
MPIQQITFFWERKKPTIGVMTVDESGMRQSSTTV